MKRLRLLIPMVALVLVLFAAGCSSGPSKAKQAYNDGTVFMEQGLYEEAIPHFTIAIQLAPDVDSAYRYRGYGYGNLGEHQNAIADLTKAIELNPDFALAVWRRGLVYMGLGRDEEAEVDFAKACSLNTKFC